MATRLSDMGDWGKPREEPPMGAQLALLLKPALIAGMLVYALLRGMWGEEEDPVAAPTDTAENAPANAPDPR
ncbi:MAG: hypothetical protein H6732_05865 [Alphaproteobacteria bacterium]|nr:hypothetical protein [Alphaproteobacteria bacterium]